MEILYQNDYAIIIPGELDKMVEFINDNLRNKPVLFFPNGHLKIDQDNIECFSLENFIENASYWITFLLAFGIWREDFLSLNNRDRCIEKRMWLGDVYLRLVNSRKKAIIYNKKFSNYSPLKTKGGYNIFKTFGIDYLSLYDEYIQKKVISKKVFRNEKFKIFNNFLLLWYKEIYINENKNLSFQKNSPFKFLLINYQYNLYFYFGFIRMYLNKIVKKII